MKRWHESLLIQYVAYFSILSLMAVVGLAIAVYYQSLRLVQSYILAQMEVVISIKENQIDNWFTDQYRTISLLSQTPSIVEEYEQFLTTKDRQNYQALQSYFTTILQTQPAIKSLSISTNSGIVSLSTKIKEEGNYQPLGNTVTYFTAENLDSIRPTLYTSPISRETAMTFATPLVDSKGDRIGVLSVDLSLEKISDIMKEATGLGETDEAYLIRKKGDANHFVDIEKTEEELSGDWVKSTGIDAVTSGEDGVAFYDNHRNIAVIGSYRWLEDKNLAILVEITQEEAFQVSGILARNLLGLGLGVSIAILCIVYLLSRKVTQPILTIAKTVNQVTDGNSIAQSHQLQTISKRGDEIGQLARGFEEMINVVDSRQQDLAEQVRKLRNKNAHVNQAQELEMSYFRALKRKAQWIRNKN